MIIRYSKDSLKFLSKLDSKSVLAWDPDFTKLTPEEAEIVRQAEISGFVDEADIDWNNLSAYA